jgi:hypothetical protein
MSTARGKSFKALAQDIAEGYLTMNPIILKPFDMDSIKGLYEAINKCQMEIRAEKFPFGDPQAIRMRNLKLQRLFGAVIVIRNYAKQKRLILL